MDLANRFQHFQTLEGTVAKLQKILQARENCLNAAREKLEGMLAAKRQLEVEVENLEARLQMVEVAQTTSEFNFDDSQLSRTRELINEIGTRLDVTEKLLNQEVQLYDRIPLDGEPGTNGEDILDQVTDYFSGRPEVGSMADSESQ
jgi:chromosome segregation ATPase